MEDVQKRSAVERLKQASLRLRGTLAEELAAPGASISEDAYNLLKFHGSYEQYDRDTATALKQQGQDKDYGFMVRVRMPGGRLTAAQYVALDGLADRFGNATLRFTTRQGVQFHGVAKGNLKLTIAAINQALLTTLAACGDVVRNVVTSPAPLRDARHARLEVDANLLSRALLPASRAYHEIFLDAAPAEDAGKEAEPLYGATYLPRKFKVALALPEDNTPDVLANDLGLVAVWRGEELAGYNVAVGGGMGMTHNRPDTYPRLASFVGSVGPNELLAVTEAVIRLQRDHGGRGDRKRARLKYLLDDRGLDWTVRGIGKYLGRPLDPVLAMPPLEVPDLLGWHAQGDGRWWLGVPVPAGRVAGALRAGLLAVAARFGANPIVTPQQDVLLSDIAEADRDPVESLLRSHGVTLARDLPALARWALACPALPTCGLALTEAERVRDPIVAALGEMLARHGLAEERISLRITGCPNGCARSYGGDIGLVGRVPGAFALFVGGDFEGTRLSFKLLERVKQADIAPTLAPLLAAFAADRQPGEGFGDFCHRTGADALRRLLAGPLAA